MPKPQESKDSIKKKSKNESSLIMGNGEMAELIRQKDWSKTDIGAITTWPQSLLFTLNLMLNSNFAMLVFWGETNSFFYNDAYRPSLGKEGLHPKILGMPAEKAWADIFDSVINVKIQHIKSGGAPTWDEDLLVPIYRNGKIEDVYWTFSYSPIFDENSEIAGVLATVVETTEKVYSLQNLKQSENQLQFAIEAAQLATWDFRPKTNKLWGNERLKDWFDLPKETELDLEQAFDGIFDEHKDRVEEAINNALDFNSDHRYDIIYSIKNIKNYGVRIVRAVGKAWFDENNNPERFNGTLQDITQQYNAEKNLKEAFFKIDESEKRFRLLANNAPVFIKITDVDGKVTFANKPWLNFIGSDLDNHIGTFGFENTHPNDVNEYNRVFESALKNQEEFNLEYRVKRKDGRYKWVVNNGVPKYNIDGTFEGFIHAFMNINDIKLQEKQKDLFIAMASHELKTPVTSVKGYVQLLLSKYKNTEDAFLLNALTTIDKQILVLTSLISDLLNLSKMKRNGLELNISEFELNSMVEVIVSQLQIVNPGHKIEITKCEDSKISGDKERLGQVVTNFLTNAIKYAPESKKIEVICSCDSSEVKVSVKDFGIGIKEENQQKIFKRFYREEGRDENTFPGFGIGLYIAADIIKKHKGEIGVKSTKGEGATFYFTLPV